MAQSARKLGANGNQECLFFSVERAPLSLSDHQYAKHCAEMNKRNAKKTLVPFFAYIWKIAVAGMFGRAFLD